MGAPLNPVPHVLRCFLEGWIDNDHVYKWGNVLYFSYTGTSPTPANADAFAADIRSAWATHVASMCPSPTQLTKVTVVDLTSTSAAEGEWDGNVPGTRGDDSIPANAAMLISYHVRTRYKGGHPRTYLYAFGNADLEGAAHWSTGAVSEAQTKWTAFLGECNLLVEGGTSINTFGSVRYKGKFLPNGGPPHYYLTTPEFVPIDTADAHVQPEMASQRRRIGRRKA